MKRMTPVSILALTFCALLIAGCGDDSGGKAMTVKKVDSYEPNLPAVPTIPKPDVPETYSDGSYSVHGARKNIGKTIDTQITVTGYVADIYEKPECPEDKQCFTLMPHLFLADEKDEEIERRLLKVVGYAKSFKEMEDQKEKDERGIEEELPEGVHLPPVVWDWREGHKYKIKGRFTRQSGEGFMATDGLLEYAGHECLDCPEEDEEEKK